MTRYKFLSILIVLLLFISLTIILTFESGKIQKEIETGELEESIVIIEFFLSSGECDECKDAEEIIDLINQEFEENITVIKYPVDLDEYYENYQKMKDYDLSYPAAVIWNTTAPNNKSKLSSGDIFTEGFLKKIINNYLKGEPTIIEKSGTICIDSPFGRICLDPLETSLPVTTIILGALDSINPCSFFVLLFLLSLLLYTKSRKRMLLIGSIFIFFSGFIYFLLMAAILNFFLVVEQQFIIAIIAGVIAIIFGALNIKDFFFFKKGPSASIPESKKPKLYQQMRKIVRITSIPSLIFGTIILAISANTVELLCSFNLPVIYTGILTSYNLNTFQYYLYILIYNIIYVIPLLIIVAVMAITLGRKKLSEFQGRMLKLFSGIMIFSLGEILLLKPILLENVFVPIGILIMSFILTFIIYLICKIGQKNQTFSE
jgi:hypothetical protein